MTKPMKMRSSPPSTYRREARLTEGSDLLSCSARARLLQFHPLWLCPSSSPKLAAGLEAVPWPQTQGPGVSLFVRFVTAHNLMAAVFSAGPTWPSGSPWAGKAARQQIWARAWEKSKALPVATAGLPCARVRPGRCQPALWLRCDPSLWAQQGKMGTRGRVTAKDPKTEQRDRFHLPPASFSFIQRVGSAANGG